MENVNGVLCNYIDFAVIFQNKFQYKFYNTLIAGRDEKNFAGRAGNFDTSTVYYTILVQCYITYITVTVVSCIGLQSVLSRDVKTYKFFGPARSSFSRPGPARNTIFNFRPVWARLGPRQNLLSLF